VVRDRVRDITNQYIRECIGNLSSNTKLVAKLKFQFKLKFKYQFDCLRSALEWIVFTVALFRYGFLRLVVLHVAVYRELHAIPDGHLQLRLLLDSLLDQAIGEDLVVPQLQFVVTMLCRYTTTNAFAFRIPYSIVIGL